MEPIERDVLIDYLLGRLSPTEVEAIERRALLDSDLAQTLEFLRDEIGAIKYERTFFSDRLHFGTLGIKDERTTSNKIGKMSDEEVKPSSSNSDFDAKTSVVVSDRNEASNGIFSLPPKNSSSTRRKRFEFIPKRVEAPLRNEHAGFIFKHATANAKKKQGVYSEAFARERCFQRIWRDSVFSNLRESFKLTFAIVDFDLFETVCGKFFRFPLFECIDNKNNCVSDFVSSSDRRVFPNSILSIGCKELLEKNDSFSISSGSSVFGERWTIARRQGEDSSFNIKQHGELILSTFLSTNELLGEDEFSFVHTLERAFGIVSYVSFTSVEYEFFTLGYQPTKHIDAYAEHYTTAWKDCSQQIAGLFVDDGDLSLLADGLTCLTFTVGRLESFTEEGLRVSSPVSDFVNVFDSATYCLPSSIHSFFLFVFLEEGSESCPEVAYTYFSSVCVSLGIESIATELIDEHCGESGDYETTGFNKLQWSDCFCISDDTTVVFDICNSLLLERRENLLNRVACEDAFYIVSSDGDCFCKHELGCVCVCLNNIEGSALDDFLGEVVAIETPFNSTQSHIAASSLTTDELVSVVLLNNSNLPTAGRLCDLLNESTIVDCSKFVEFKLEERKFLGGNASVSSSSVSCFVEPDERDNPIDLSLSAEELRLLDLLGREPTTIELDEYYWEDVVEASVDESDGICEKMLRKCFFTTALLPIIVGRVTIGLYHFWFPHGFFFRDEVKAKSRRKNSGSRISDMMISMIVGILIGVGVFFPALKYVVREVFLTVAASKVRKISINRDISLSPQEMEATFTREIAEHMLFPEYNTDNSQEQLDEVLPVDGEDSGFIGAPF